jgi:peptide deformylase
MENKIITIEEPDHNALLHSVSRKIKNPHDTDVLFTMQQMERICKQSGVAGIAAIQLGHPYRMFAVCINKSKPVKFYFNPKIVIYGEIIETKTEGCLSVPDKQGKIKRSKSVAIKYQDRNLKMHYEVLESKTPEEALYTQCVQHEMDHLDGVLYIDKAEAIYSNEEMEAIFAKAQAAKDLEISLQQEFTSQIFNGDFLGDEE